MLFQHAWRRIGRLAIRRLRGRRDLEILNRRVVTLQVVAAPVHRFTALWKKVSSEHLQQCFGLIRMHPMTRPR